MTKKSHLARHAGSALAAALALTATPVLAQDISAAPPPVDVAPTITVPDIAPATPPAVPQAEVPADPAPVVTAEPAPVAPVVRETATRPAATPARTSAAARMTAAPAPVAAAAEPVAAEPTAVENLPPVTAVPAPVITDTTPVLAEEPAASSDNTMTISAVLAGLVALALLGIGLVAFRRRTPPSQLAESAPLEPDTLQSRRAAAIVPTLPVAAEQIPAVAETAPVVTESAPVYREPIAINRPTPAASLSHEGASVALPREMPKTYEERDALMRRMIAAKPDRANPFTSPIQRYHRAKLIMQSLGRNFGDAKPWIDLSQYPQNWPELQNRYAAAA